MGLEDLDCELRLIRHEIDILSRMHDRLSALRDKLSGLRVVDPMAAAEALAESLNDVKPGPIEAVEIAAPKARGRGVRGKKGEISQPVLTVLETIARIGPAGRTQIEAESGKGGSTVMKALAYCDQDGAKRWSLNERGRQVLSSLTSPSPSLNGTGQP